MELESYQKEYLLSLNEYSEELDNLILGLEDNFSADVLAQIKRRVHSIKGAAASYDFAFASTICHNFEDFLESKAKETTLSPDTIDHFIKYNDLLKDYINSFYNNTMELNDLKQRLYAVNSVEQDQVLVNHVLIVDPTKTFKKICEHTLRELSIRVSSTDNGYTALGRLLNEDFDAIVISKELKYIDGPSLVQILKTVKSLDLNLPQVLVSSNTENLNLESRPDYVIKKDENFTKTLQSTFKTIFNESKDSEMENEVKTEIESIAYVDDDKDVHTLVKMSLQKYNPEQEIYFYTDPKEGLGNILNNPPSLILLDVEMPVMNGTELFERLKQAAPDHPWKVIFFTGNSQPKKVKELMDLGAIAVIKKPFKPQSLFSEISKAYLKAK